MTDVDADRAEGCLGRAGQRSRAVLREKRDAWAKAVADAEESDSPGANSQSVEAPHRGFSCDR